MESPPKLDARKWNGLNLLGALFLVMALGQLLGFNEFKGWFSAVGLSPESTWAGALILAEIWAGLSFMRLRLAPAFRLVGHGLGLLVAGFWFIENLNQVTASATVANSGFFGKYLVMAPGWWTVLEVTIFLYYTIYAVDTLKNSK